MVRDLRVCFVGDSFVAGIGDPQHLGWVGRLASRTHGAAIALTAYNLGVRRQTSAQVLDRWQDECSARLPAGCEARVVVSFGVNDTTVEDGRQRVAVLDTARHLSKLLHGARSAGWAALVVGPPPVADPAHNARTTTLDALLRSVAAEDDVPYVGTITALMQSPIWMAQVAASDGAHPSAEGYTALTDLVWPTWNAWLQLQTPS